MLRAWTSKPPVGTQIDPWHPFLANQCKLVYALNEGAGPTVWDGITGFPLTATGGPAWAQGPSGPALSCVGTSVGATALLPPSLKISTPITAIIGVRILGYPSSAHNDHLIGCIYDEPVTAPSWPYVIYLNGPSGALNVYYSKNATTGANVASSYVPPLNKDIVLALELTATTITIYANGVQTFTTTGITAVPQYSSTSTLLLGSDSTATGTENHLVYFAAIYNGILGSALHARIGANVNAIWEMFPIRRIYGRSAAVGGASSYWGCSVHRPKSRPIDPALIPLIYG